MQQPPGLVVYSVQLCGSLIQLSLLSGEHLFGLVDLMLDLFQQALVLQASAYQVAGEIVFAGRQAGVQFLAGAPQG